MIIFEDVMKAGNILLLAGNRTKFSQQYGLQFGYPNLRG